ncbi:hypothetical protein [Mycobacterium sp. AZCC_0083]|nr:hypothetical protein [Mycobacterium sp. AZCC_0083]MBB5165082.1 hypothetical protein [Mycobacterium sp. AZCC_0083]
MFTKRTRTKSVIGATIADKLWFPGIQTGTTCKAKVECPVGGVDFFNPTY